MSRSFENMDFSKYMTSGSLLDQLHAVLAHMPKNSPGRHSQHFMRGLAQCMPFEVRDSAAALVFSVMTDRNGEVDPIEAFRGMRLPMKSTWVEYSLRAADKDLVPSKTPLVEQMGVLLLEKPDGKIRVVGCMKSRVTPPIVIPLIKEIDPETGQSTTAFSEGGRVFFGGGSSDLERAKREVDFAVAGLRHTAIFAARFLTLLNAGRTPIERAEPTRVEEGTRRLMRKNAPSGVTPTFQGMTRIELNRYGADHVDALREEAEVRAGRKIRPHWVRGHLMRTESKGPVWRRAHVRGIGDPVMSTRSAVYTDAPQQTGSEDGPSL
jgi:hypothetical protein